MCRCAAFVCVAILTSSFVCADLLVSGQHQLLFNPDMPARLPRAVHIALACGDADWLMCNGNVLVAIAIP